MIVGDDADATAPAAKQQRTAEKPQVSAHATKENSILLSVRPSQPSDEKKNPMVFVLDTSDSMGFGNTGMAATPIHTLKNGMATSVRAIPLGTAVCIVAFGSYSRVILETQSLTETERQKTMETIAELNTNGGTNLMNGLEEAAKFIYKLPNSEDANTLVLTDGAANSGVCDPARLAAAIPYGAVHAIMFTVDSDIEYAKRVRDLKPAVNTAHFVQSGEDLSKKLESVTKTMKASELKCKVGTQERVFPPSCVESEMFVLFDASPDDDPDITVVYNGHTLVQTKFSQIVSTDLDPALIDLHVRREKAYQKICGINDKVKQEADKDDESQSWEMVFDEEAADDLAQPEELLKDLGKLNVSIHSGHAVVFRSLAAAAADLNEVRTDVLEIETGAAFTAVPELEELVFVEPPTYQKVKMDSQAGAAQYRSLGAAAGDDEDEQPVYRSLGSAASSREVAVYSEEGQRALLLNEAINARNHAAKSEYAAAVNRAANRKSGRKHRLASLPVMA